MAQAVHLPPARTREPGQDCQRSDKPAAEFNCHGFRRLLYLPRQIQAQLRAQTAVHDVDLLTAGLRIQLALALTHLLSDKLGRKRAVIEEKPSQREGVAVSQTADTGNRFEIRVAGRLHVDAPNVVTGEQCR